MMLNLNDLASVINGIHSTQAEIECIQSNPWRVWQGTHKSTLRESYKDSYLRTLKAQLKYLIARAREMEGGEG
jgi:hypothetical protein